MLNKDDPELWNETFPMIYVFLIVMTYLLMKISDACIRFNRFLEAKIFKIKIVGNIVEG